MFLSDQIGHRLKMPEAGVIRIFDRKLDLRDEQGLGSEGDRADAGQGDAKFRNDCLGFSRLKRRYFSECGVVGEGGIAGCLLARLIHGTRNPDARQRFAAVVRQGEFESQYGVEQRCICRMWSKANGNGRRG